MAQEERKTFLTEAGIQGEERVDDFPDYEDVAGTVQESQSTALLKQQQKMRVMDDALEYMKREYRARMEEVGRKEEKLKRDKAAMEAMVERFRDFINDNDAKKNRALEKARKERNELQRLLEQEQSLREQQQRMTEEKERRAAELARMRRYAEYLLLVVESSDGEFREPSEILSRHETLWNTQRLQEQEAEERRTKMEQLRKQMALLRTQSTNHTLRMNSELQRRQRDLDDARSHVAQLESQQEATETGSRQRVVESSQVEMSVHNLYSRCLAHAGRPGHMKVDRPDDLSDSSHFTRYLMDCLEQVRRRMLDLKWIAENFPAWRRRIEEEEARQRAVHRAEAEEAEAARRQREAAQARAAARRRELRRRVTGSEEEDEEDLLGGGGGGGVEGGVSEEPSLPMVAATEEAGLRRTGRRRPRRAGAAWLDSSGSEESEGETSMFGHRHHRRPSGAVATAAATPRSSRPGRSARRGSLAESQASFDSNPTASRRQSGVGHHAGGNTFVVRLGRRGGGGGGGGRRDAWTERSEDGGPSPTPGTARGPGSVQRSGWAPSVSGRSTPG